MRTVEVRDVGDAVVALTGKVRNLEQLITSPKVMGYDPNPTFETITIDTPGGGGGESFDNISSPATGLTLTPGTFFDNVWVDVAWTAPADGSGHEYQLEVAKWNGSSYEMSLQYRTASTTVRVENLRPNTVYGFRVYTLNKFGIVSDPLPAVGFTDATTDPDTTIPGLATNLVVTAGFRTILATWTEAPEEDIEQYEAQIAQSSDFLTSPRSVFVGGGITSFTDLATDTTYWVRVRAVDYTGNAGPWTAGASATTGEVQTGDIALLAVDSARIADAAIGTAKIGDLQVTNAKISDLAVEKILAGTITSKDFILGAGGQFKTATLAPGILLNSQGLSLYDNSGSRVVYLDSVSGVATFTGTVDGSNIIGSTITGGLIRTAASGARVEIVDSFGEYIRFFSGYVNETSPGNVRGYVDTFSNQLRISLDSPYIGSGPRARISVSSPTNGAAGAGNITLDAGGVTGGINYIGELHRNSYEFKFVKSGSTVISASSSGNFINFSDSGDYFHSTPTVVACLGSLPAPTDKGYQVLVDDAATSVGSFKVYILNPNGTVQGSGSFRVNWIAQG